MPTTYAHDLFGQKVYRQLPDQVKEIIRKNGELYRIGLHGPDIFFYYFIFKNHVSSVGYRMHKEKPGHFLPREWRRSERLVMRHFLPIFLALAVIIFWTLPVILL